ncbi:hypothetical protein N1031_17030 [Herbiconiux moechotypicola]|uniref:Hpt domain-containing protein n=1 Tax=Herbiconiux moechotypicola TaxID=637393 RepID=A0ABN3DQW2_9MICO|nr:hypothetical protein [Herbiconiux moechotypicola]MCS5731467.1 hypothetical protein [Herbiconiux moechotypicola]
MTRYVDRATALDLLGVVGDDEHRGRFVHDFINLWETRSQRLMKALGIRDFEDADVVLLSIRSSSTMLGAWPLEAIAGMVHSAVKAEDLAGAMRHLARLHEVGSATCTELVSLLESLGGHLPAPGPPGGGSQSSSEAASR